MLLAISLYRLPDFVRGPMTNPFFHDIGMSKDVIGAARGTIGVWCRRFLGIAAGGFLSVRLGYMRAIILGGILQATGIAAHALLTLSGPNVPLFMGVTGLRRFINQHRRHHTGGLHVEPDLARLHRDAICAAVVDLCVGGQGARGILPARLSRRLSAHVGLPDKVRLMLIFFIGAGLIGIPAVLLFSSARSKASCRAYRDGTVTLPRFILSAPPVGLLLRLG